MKCPKCQGIGYSIGTKGEFAYAEACECQRDCTKCRGAQYLIAKEGIYEVARPCECVGLHNRVRLFNDAEIPGGYARKTLSPLRPKDPEGFQDRGNPSLVRAKEAVNRYRVGVDPDNARGLVLMGGCGLGKTHLACGLLSFLTLQRGMPCRFIDYFSLLARIRETFDRGQREGGRDSEREVIDAQVDVPVLVIDDLGKGKGSAWELTILDQIVTRRYNAKRVIIATTNYLLEEQLEAQMGTSKRRTGESLEERIGERLVSRLHASCDMLLLDGSDYRVSGPRASR